MTKAAPETSGLTPVRHVLPNGAVVIVQETAFSPAVTISMAFRASSLNEPEELTGLAWFLARVIDRGTTTRSANAIAEALDDRGVALRVTTNRHVVALSCTCLSEDFSDVLAVVADVARKPVFPEAEIEKRRSETITSIRQDLDNPGIRAAEALQALLYGPSHPYGRPAKGSLESVEHIRREHLARLSRGASRALRAVRGHRRRRARRGCRGQLAAAFDGWDAVPEPERGVPPVARLDAGAARHRDAGQAAVGHRLRLHQHQPP